MEVTPPAAALIATEGYDPAFGARPLKRAIQRLVQNPLAVRILEGELEDGDAIRVDVSPSGTELVFERAEQGVTA